MASAIQILSTVVSTLKPERRELKRQYDESLMSKFFVVSQGHEPEPNAAAIHVANAFRAWAERFSLPPGDADVLMIKLGNLSQIATADRALLDMIPMEDSTKNTVQAFFGSGGQSSHQQNHSLNSMPQSMSTSPAGVRTQETYMTPPPSYQLQQTDQARSMPRSSNLHPSPQDSIVGIMHAEQDERMEFSRFQSAWEEPGRAARATHELQSQHFLPSYEQARPSIHPPAVQGGPLVRTHNGASQRLLPRFNHIASRSSRNGPMGNRIRPTSSFSSASTTGGHPMQGYYR